MNPRAFAAGVLAHGIGATALPTDTWAGAGGYVAAPSLMARGVGHQTAAPHLAVSSARPFVRQPVNNGFRAPMNGLRFSQFRGRHERGFPWWWTYANGAPYDYPSYYPPEYLPTYGLPATAYPPIEYPPQSPRVVPHEPECRTDTQKVPSEAGGETTINITRCY